MKKYSADLGLLLVGFIWGTGFIATKIGLDGGITPYYMMFLRAAFASIFISVIFFRELRNVTRREVLAGVLLGVFLYLGFSFQTVGLVYTTASKNAFLTAINVVLVPYLYWMFYKKRPDIFAVLSAVLCLCGIGLLSLTGTDFSLNKGDILTMICAVFFACHITFTGILSKKVDAIRLNLVQMYTMTVFSFITCVFNGSITLNVTQTQFLAVLYLGIFSTGICFLLQTTCQQYTTPARASILLCTESLFAPVLSFLILHEVLTPKAIAGAALILISVIVSETKLGFGAKKEQST
ncbi:MAG: EamA family transporter [Sebaldella sp.]|jgi:drug/metabolite transporter (DMT)-like permease|nr:EamA family transporter [Sebaldella sp.]